MRPFPIGSRKPNKKRMALKKRGPHDAAPGFEVDASEIRSRIAKLTSKESVPDPIAVQEVSVVSSGLLSLDHALGVGGFARGRFHSIEGPEGSGKTALAIAAVGNFQRLHPRSVHAFIDVEHTADYEFFSMLGADIDPKRLIILRPETAEEACTMVMSLMGYSIQNKLWKRDLSIAPVSTITYDSWAGSPTEEVGRAQLARVGSEWIPKIATTAGRMETTIFWINQIRENPGMAFGDPRYSPGGRALKHAQTTRLWVSTTNVEKNDLKMRVAHDLRIDVQKNKVAPPFRCVYLTLNYRTGFDRITDAFCAISKHGIDFKEAPGGNVYTFSFREESGDLEKIRKTGEKAFLDAIRGTPCAAEAFLRKAEEVLKEKGDNTALKRQSGESKTDPDRRILRPRKTKDDTGRRPVGRKK